MKAWWKHDRTIVECWNITGSSKYIIRSVSIEYENRKSKVKSGVTMIFFLQQVRNWARQERKKNLPVSDLDTGTNWEWKHLNFVPNWEKTAETSTRKRAGKCPTWSKKKELKCSHTDFHSTNCSMVISPISLNSSTNLLGYIFADSISWLGWI